MYGENRIVIFEPKTYIHTRAHTRPQFSSFFQVHFRQNMTLSNGQTDYQGDDLFAEISIEKLRNIRPTLTLSFL